jgi:hypothetical protein
VPGYGGGTAPPPTQPPIIEMIQKRAIMAVEILKQDKKERETAPGLYV